MKRILLVTYYFPPCGGASVQRWLRLLPELSRSDFQISVLTTVNGDYPLIDNSLLDQLPESVKVHRTYTPVFGKIFSFLTKGKKPLPYGNLSRKSTSSIVLKVLYWIRLNLIIPDARVVWNRFAYKKAVLLHNENKYDIVITTGPPHSTHLVGMKLKKKFGMKWFTDFRDPWTKIYYMLLEKQNVISQVINAYFEKRVLKQADLNLVISDWIAEQLPIGNKATFYNGYCQTDFCGLEYSTSNLFRIKYIGQITAGQDINGLLTFISSHASQNNLKDISVSFVGSDAIISDLSGMTIEKLPFLPHKKSLHEMVNAELLILIINKYSQNKGMLTTKLFEYIGSRTPVLSIGPLAGEAAKIISSSAAGMTFEIIDDEVWQYVYDAYSKWKNKSPVRNDKDISQWSVQHQVKHLEHLIEKSH